jgi:hypothetical protein
MSCRRSGGVVVGRAGLPASRRFHEVERGLKQLEILLVLGRLGAVDLDPFPRAGHAAGLKRNDVAPGKPQLGDGGGGQPKSDAVAADAGEHLVADEVSVEAVDCSGADAGEFEKQSIDLRFGTGFGGGSVQGDSLGLFATKYHISLELLPTIVGHDKSN